MQQYETFETYYTYTVNLEPHIVKKIDDYFVIQVDGEAKFIQHDSFRFTVKNAPLTYKEVINKFEGTKGIISIEGKFAIPKNEIKGWDQ